MDNTEASMDSMLSRRSLMETTSSLPVSNVDWITIGLLVVLFLVILWVYQTLMRNIILIHRPIEEMVRAQRYSSLLEFRGAELSVSPEEFEPNRQKVGEALRHAITYIEHDVPRVWADRVIERSGLDMFLREEPLNKIRMGLARLRANDNITGALKFSDEIIAQL